MKIIISMKQVPLNDSQVKISGDNPYHQQRRSI